MHQDDDQTINESAEDPSHLITQVQDLYRQEVTTRKEMFKNARN